MVANYLPEMCLLLFSLFPIFILQTLVLPSTFSCCYLTSFAYFPSIKLFFKQLQGPCQMPFCILSMPFYRCHSNCLLQFLNIIFSQLISIFFDTPFVPLATISYFPDAHIITKYSSEYLPHKRQVCYWSKVGDTIPFLPIFHNVLPVVSQAFMARFK